MLRRKAMDELLEWKMRPGHKCLLVRGQRQVGKTFIIREFAKTYENSIYLDLSDNERVRKIFDGSLETDRLIQEMKIYANASAPPKKTLIILDEIQSCPRARASLKSFTADGRYDVVATGSLLDVTLREDGKEGLPALIPVGYEEHMHMHGLDFEEFLWAMGCSEEQTKDLRSKIRKRSRLSEVELEVFQDRFREFTIVGGMPAAVAAYAETGDLESVGTIQRAIIASFHDDVSKYSPRSVSMKIRRCFDSIPAQLSDTNKKFMWSRIDPQSPESRTGARFYSDALLWVEGAGIANCCCRLREIAQPLSMRKDLSNFKVYMSDTGMLVSLMGHATLYAIYSGDDKVNQGAIAENAVAECLTKAGFELGFYINRKNPGRMELDFVLELGLETAVIEVKSGKSREAPSLSKTIGDARFQRRIMLEKSNISVDDDGIEHYPLFAAAFIDEMQKPMPELKTGSSACE